MHFARLGLTVLAASTVLVGPGVATASATSQTFTVTAGTASAGTSVGFTARTHAPVPAIILNDDTSGMQWTCDSASFVGHITAGAGLPGADIGTVGGEDSWTNCVGPLGWTIFPSAVSTWHVDVDHFNPTNQLSRVVFTSVQLDFPDTNGMGCIFTLTGTESATYSNLNHALVLQAGSSLITSNEQGCLGLILDGDTWSLSGRFAVSTNYAPFNPITITSP